MLPLSGLVIPPIISRSVDFPLPVRPIIAVISFSAIESDTPESADIVPDADLYE